MADHRYCSISKSLRRLSFHERNALPTSLLATRTFMSSAAFPCFNLYHQAILLFDMQIRSLKMSEPMALPVDLSADTSPGEIDLLSKIHPPCQQQSSASDILLRSKAIFWGPPASLFEPFSKSSAASPIVTRRTQSSETTDSPRPMTVLGAHPPIDAIQSSAVERNQSNRPLVTTSAASISGSKIMAGGVEVE